MVALRRTRSAALRLALCSSAAAGAAAGAVVEHSVSGVSAGADMAVQHLVAFSKATTGAAIVAGAPYGCNLIEGPDDKCGSAPPETDWSTLLPIMAARLEHRAREGLIDPLAHLWSKRLYLFSGKKDWVVARSVMEAVRRQLEVLTGAGSIAEDFGVDAAHGWVVDGSTCGPGPPGSPSSWCAPCCCSPSMLLSCEGHDLAGRLLQHLLGRAPAEARVPASSPLIEVSQAKYVPEGFTTNSSGLWDTAYVYAPLRCRTEEVWCDVHVHYHGCVWGAEYTGTDLLMRLGLVEWAEAGSLVIVFPQASSTVDPAGCWDWEGQTGPLFDTKQGPQLATVMAMVQDLPRILTAGQQQRTLVLT